MYIYDIRILDVYCVQLSPKNYVHTLPCQIQLYGNYCLHYVLWQYFSSPRNSMSRQVVNSRLKNRPDSVVQDNVGG